MAAERIRDNAAPQARAPSSPWILDRWSDLLLFVATPLLILPLILLLHSDWMGVSAETLSIYVAAFGALGHHLPGMIRAYGDRELFLRFWPRFIFAPVFLLAICIPLSLNHLNGMLVILLLWGAWHGLMQVYGFVRIYDVKVGSISAITANLDWLMCLSWFATGLLFSDVRVANLLETIYSAGGPVISPEYVDLVRWGMAIVTATITLGFIGNYVWQFRRGTRPNPVKIYMLASGIGFWWLAMVYVNNILLGIAMFEIFHDVQYLAIVWIYNRRRVDRASEMGSVMRFLFRRSAAMLLLYVGLVFAYGYISIVANDAVSGTLKSVLVGTIWASTILHFYYDGFIWKVREKSIREGLGMAGGKAQATHKTILWGELSHALKWSPMIILLCWMSLKELSQSYPPMPGMVQRLWPDETRIQWNENITQIAPAALEAHARLAAMLDNVGRTQEAKDRLRQLLELSPSFARGHLLLGDIHRRLGEHTEAIKRYQQAASNSRSANDRKEAHFHLGETYQSLGHWDLAVEEYRSTLQIDPNFTPAVEALRITERQARESRRSEG